jgi:hypothetical protein
VTVICPNGHSSATGDYCDTCGAPIAVPEAPPAEAPAPATEPGVETEDEDTSPSHVQAPCPRCGATRSGDDRYCEGCGHDFLAAPSSGPAWEATATADRAQFERFAVEGISFPADAPARRFVLDSDEVVIGRSSAGRGETPPEIDLAGPGEDPGISRRHAALERQSDGSYAVRDLGSTNGTTVNDDPAPRVDGPAVPLADGDRIRLGAWTTITVRSR